MYNAVSLFSGALGLDLGVEQAGFKVRVCVELDKHCCETIRTNTNIPVIEKDINEVSTTEILRIARLKKGEVDLVLGGPPCQAFSTAGKRRSLTDFRGNVIINFLRIVDEIRPKAFLLENVRGLLSAKLHFVPNGLSKEYGHLVDKPGSVVYFLVKELEKLGYKISFSLFDSANYGVPERRERVMIFGGRGRTAVSLPLPTHTQDGQLTGQKWATFEEAVIGLKENKQHWVELSEKAKKYLKNLKPGQYWKHLSRTDQIQAMGKSYYLSGGKTGFYRRLNWNKPSPTLVTSPVMPATMLCHPTKLRPLSIEEYMRIQQFPDDWRFSGTINQIYKQIGNAVPVGLGVAAGKAIRQFLDGKVHRQSQYKDGLQRLSRYHNTDHTTFFVRFDLVHKDIEPQALQRVSVKSSRLDKSEDKK